MNMVPPVPGVFVFAENVQLQPSTATRILATSGSRRRAILRRESGTVRIAQADTVTESDNGFLLGDETIELGSQKEIWAAGTGIVSFISEEWSHDWVVGNNTV